MDLNKLRDEAYTDACKHGWHKEEHSDEHWLMLVLTEIAEAVQADRKGRYASVGRFNAEADESFFLSYREYISSTVQDELADIVIRCLDLAGLKNINFRHAEALLSEGTNKVQVTFPELMYYACEETTYHGYSLAEKLNAIVAGIIVYCGQKGIDIEWFVEQKMKYNRLRTYKHGGLKY